MPGLDSGEISLYASFLLSSHGLSSVHLQVGRERERSISLPVLIRTPFYWTREPLF